MRHWENIFFWSQGTFFQNFGFPISQGSLSQLPRWVFLGQYYPLKGPRCIKTPRVFKTIKLFCTDDRLQLIITFLESIRIHQNQNKMVKWTSRYCPILKLLKTVEDFAFHKHNYHSVPRHWSWGQAGPNGTPHDKKTLPTTSRRSKNRRVGTGNCCDRATN